MGENIMAVSVEFYAMAIKIPVPSSGLGWYSASFGGSVPVGDYGSLCFITDSNGLTQGTQVHSTIYQNVSSGIINTASSGVAVTAIPNLYALNCRFIPDGASVKTQNAKFRVTHRGDINSNPSGVTVQCCEVIHPDTVQNNNGSGDTGWQEVYGSGSILSLTSSPGVSGEYINGSETYSSQQHDWYVLVSPSPDSISSKYFQGYFSLEYL